ncbi:MAG: preprotein translocase subunit YajC [Actinobacteria bacterium HGW-Actinobacteria-7]|jgi:preprotein translocase subunit YajC|nr:MAG: preprotein translocase subunit YajC [Actinobacteria bacterium HGW-Actinobacteria-7]
MSSQFTNLVFIGAMVAIFYFLLIRPQQRRAKQQQKMLSELTPGTSIVTVGGIFATVVEVGARVRVRVFDGSVLEIAKNAISNVVDPAGEELDVVAEAADEAVPESDE